MLEFYVGTGLGHGFSASKKIANKELPYEDQISFISGQTDTIHILEKNSSYLFYLKEGSDEVEISPINSGAIKSIVEKR